MGYVYPPAAPSYSGDVLQISRFLNNPGLIAQRLAELLQQRYIADVLLSGRYVVSGGAVSYESGEPLGVTDNPQAVAPGSEYPLTGLGAGTPSLAKTVKWGQDTEVTDESIARQKMQPVNKALNRLANQNVKYVDSVALSAISSAVTATQAAAASWSISTAEQKLLDVATAKASILALNQGYDPDTVVVDDMTWAYAYAKFLSGGFLPRESGNPTETGQFPIIDGMRWLITPNLPTPGTILVLDSKMLGGMADEDLGGPGYAKVGGLGVETKSIRKDDDDKWRLRCRRVTVPVVNEPAAARKITGA